MNRKGQVWIETVIYILIGLALIGLVLTFVMPRITEQRDRIVIEQTIASLGFLDGRINEVIDTGRDNRRIVEFGMRRGELYFDSDNDRIIFVLRDLTKPYSEPGIKIPVGRIVVESMEEREGGIVNLTLQYKNIANLSFDNREIERKFDASVTPYKFSIENNGILNNLYRIDISEIS